MSRRRTFVADNSPEIDLMDDDFSENLNVFLSDLKFRDSSKYTIDYYRRELRKFMHTLEEQRFNTRLRRLDSTVIKDGYIRYMYEENGVEHATIAATMRALKAFLNWAVGQGRSEEHTSELQS